jgi:hypothetical protein
VTIDPLPNGGDECVEQGVTCGQDGEAALVPWEMTGTGGTWATLETRLFTVPLRIEREFTLAGPVLRLAETVTNESPADLEVMWSHHPAFGARSWTAAACCPRADGLHRDGVGPLIPGPVWRAASALGPGAAALRDSGKGILRTDCKAERNSW